LGKEGSISDLQSYHVPRLRKFGVALVVFNPGRLKTLKQLSLGDGVEFVGLERMSILTNSESTCLFLEFNLKEPGNSKASTHQSKADTVHSICVWRTI